MGYLGTAVTAIGTGLLINLALTLAVIRRVQRHGEQLAKRPGTRPRALEVPVGSQAPDFAVPTAAGGIRSLSDLTGAPSLIAFLSAGCLPCRRQLPEFKEYARTIPGGATQVLAVICSNQRTAGDLAEELEGTATIAVEPLRGAMQTAFSVSGYPTFYLLDASGLVQAGAVMVRNLAPAQLV
jgi:peroxiredoxin